MSGKMTPRTLLVFLFAFGLLLGLAGCGEENNYVDVNYHQGSEGLAIEFSDNSPPEKVYPTQPYPITIRLANVGAFSILDQYDGDDLSAEALLIYDPYYFKPTADRGFSAIKGDRLSGIHLEGKSPFWPEGESRIITIGALEALPLDKRRIGADSDISVSLCYPYATELTTPVCVDMDPYEEAERGYGCDAETLSFVDQGAPVAVTSVEVQSVPAGIRPVTVFSSEPVVDDQGLIVDTRTVEREEMETVVVPTFMLTLQHVGNGQVVRAREIGEQKTCVKEAGEEAPGGSVKVDAWLSGRKLDCDPLYPTLLDGTAEVRCSMKDVLGGPNREEILQVVVSYVYQERTTITVEVDDSFKEYQPIAQTPYQCRDFDHDYDLCRSAGDGSLGFTASSTSGLDCYYCDSLKRCMGGASECNQCPDGQVADDKTRWCGAECSPPTVSITADPQRGKMSIACHDPAGMKPNERKRCGCYNIHWELVQSETECVEAMALIDPEMSSPKALDEFFNVINATYTADSLRKDFYLQGENDLPAGTRLCAIGTSLSGFKSSPVSAALPREWIEMPVCPLGETLKWSLNKWMCVKPT